jgi:hypothetical protein
MKSTRTVFSTPGGSVGKGVGVRDGAGVKVGRRVAVSVGRISLVGVELGGDTGVVAAGAIAVGCGWVQPEKQMHAIRKRMDRVRGFIVCFLPYWCDGLLPGVG